MHCDHRRIRHIVRNRRNKNARRPAFDVMEGRQLLAASITLNANGVLAVVGDTGADRATVNYAEKTTPDANGLPVTSSDTTTIVARVQCEPNGQAIEKIFAAGSVKAVTYSGQGGTDLFVNKTTATSTWSTTGGGVVNTSLMVGSPGYNAPDAAAEVGKFRVGSNGKVGIDYLYRGAGYAGQLGIFSLTGMEKLAPGSVDYIKEATRRALSETTQGHVAIRVQNEAAKFTATTPWEGNFNTGTYKGVHTLAMTPGDTFAAILVPSGTFEQVAANPAGATGSLRPLFSLPAANPYTITTQLLGQVGDLDGQGSLFAFEDLRLDGSSDKDYNDMVFQVTGARGKATPVSEVFNPQKNFVATTAFQSIGTYATQKEQADAATAISSLGAGVLKVGSTPSVQVNYLRDDVKTSGEVAIVSLQGMEYLQPGSPAFNKEAARRALTDTNLGHVIASDAFDASQAESNSSYHGRKSYPMAAGDSYAVLDVDGGTVFGLYSRNGAAGNSKVRCSVVSANATNSDAASLYSTAPGTASNVTVTFGGTVLDLGGSSVKATDVAPAPKAARVGVTAYLDKNSNGQIDASDPSLGGVTITLTGTDFTGKSVSQTLTSTGHGCVFFENVPAGKYRITSSDGTKGTLVGGSSAGTVGGSAYLGSVSDITILPGDNAADYTLGRVQPGTTRGRVYADDNHDRRYQDGEAGIPGVVVQLTGTDDRGASVSLSTRTLADGTYNFAGLRPGTYRLQETQPAGYLDGRESAGSFVGQAHPIDRNGLVRNDIFSGIALRAGEVGYQYDFGEWTSAAGEVSYKKEIDLSGTNAADLIVIDAGARTITVNGVATRLDATTATLVSFDNLGTNDLVKVVGSSAAESFTATPGSSTFVSPLLRAELNGTAAVVFQGGAGDRAYLYDSTGNDVYGASPTFQHLVGPEYDVTTSGSDRVYCYANAGGDDSATLTDSAGDDTFKATPTDARLYGNSFYNYVKGFDRVTGTSNGQASDRASLYDSAGDDSFVGNPTGARMSGNGYTLNATGFARIDGIASAGGKDRATLSGSQGDDKLSLSPNDNELSGAGYDLHATGFTSVVGDGAGGGADRAYLTGTQGDDTLIASSASSRLVGPGLDVTALAFPWVSANGASCIGHDTAVFLDSADRDTVEAAPYSARMYATSYQVRASGFDILGARSTQGGRDKLVLADSAGDDLIAATPGQASLTNGAFTIGGTGFGQVEINAVNGGNDKAILTDSAGDDVLRASGEVVDLTSLAGDVKLTGVKQVEATGTTGTNRKRIEAVVIVLSTLGEWSS